VERDKKMIVDTLATYSEWKQSFLAGIEAQPHSVAKGDAFVQKILQFCYDLSEIDAIDATECAGSGDRGIDAVFISQVENSDAPHAIVVQGKYSTAGKSLDVYSEAQKFLLALKSSHAGTSINPSVDKIAGVLTNAGTAHYIIATFDPLTKQQKEDLENIRKIASSDFGDKIIFESTDLKKIYNMYVAYGSIETTADIKVNLRCQFMSVQDDVYIGITSLANMFDMMSDYAKSNEDVVDSIYDHNIRKYLKRRSGSVNDGIYQTLDKEPSRFIAYNNGITIICNAAYKTAQGLQLDKPYIVNGCQTTRTLYNFMETKFAGIDMLSDTNDKLLMYQKAFMTLKVLVVEDTEDNPYAKLITRYSNKQNAIRGKDFLALEEMYKGFKTQLSTRGYFLETQAGEYDVLPKHKRVLFPKDTNVISTFEATLFYAAGMLGKPHDAFGRSGDFMPGGEKFEEMVKTLTVDDLFIPWIIAGQAKEKLGYTTYNPRNAKPNAMHRIQTRHHFLYFFFRLVKELLVAMNVDTTKENLYHFLEAIKANYDQYPQENHPFFQLLSLTDGVVYTFMTLAAREKWYTDRNSFLHREESIDEVRIIQGTAATNLKISSLVQDVQQIMGLQVR